jgi:hypothetical protein
MPDCPACQALAFTCIRCAADRWAGRVDDDGRDVAWTRDGLRCCACSRDMRRVGDGWACNSCGLAVNEHGQEIRL